MKGQWLCFWRKPDQLKLTFQSEKGEIMESEVERAEKAIEVSHGSVGEFSRSAASQVCLKCKVSMTCLFAWLIILSTTISILLPLFWFGSVPKISEFMKRGKAYRLPVTIAVEVILLFLICFCVFRLVRAVRSMHRRVSYLSTCSNRQFNAGFDPNVSPSSKRSCSWSPRSGDGRSKRFSSSISSLHVVALRQILEEFPEDCVKRIQELSRAFLSSGNGRSSIVPGKFNLSQKILVDSSFAQTYKVAAKVLLIGDINVGKTSIFHRILYDQFSSSYLQTIGADLGFSTLNLSNESETDQLSVGLQIWDIGGQEHLARATKLYCKDAVIVIPVVDITNVESLHSLHNWLRDTVSKIYDPYVVLLLNKADLESKAIAEADIDKIEELRHAERFEVSAKTGANVSRAFTETIAKVLIKEASKLL